MIPPGSKCQIKMPGSHLHGQVVEVLYTEPAKIGSISLDLVCFEASDGQLYGLTEEYLPIVKRGQFSHD